MLKQYKLRFYNFRLVIFLLAISVIGIVLVGSAREDLKSKQLVGVILGLIIMVILSLMDYSWISNFQWIMYGANIVLLLIVRLFGDSANGAARWIDFGFIRFQPTELSKIIIILFFARFFMDHEEDLNTLKVLAEAAVLLAIPLVLIYAQPDMKNTIMVTLVFCILLYMAGLRYRIIGGAILIAIPLIIIFLSIVVQPDQKLIQDYQRKRIMSFLYPENEEYSENIEQQNNKNTLMLLAVFCILIYIAGLSYKIIGGMFLIIIPLAIIFVSIVVQPDQKLIKDYQRKRIMAFLYPENEEYSDDIEQQNNSKTAIASGELIGKKLSGDKEVASVNDGNFVSENQTDFIFAVAGEEYGFMGCCSIVILLLAISVECIRMSLRAKDLSGKIICCGMASIISLQSFLNICVATGIAPNTGTPLPFVSYGLTSLISLYIGMGMVLNVGLQSSAYNKEIRRKAIDQKEDYL